MTESPRSRPASWIHALSWLPFVYLSFQYVQLLGYPTPPVYCAYFVILVFCCYDEIVAPRSLYCAGLAMLVFCPLFMIANSYAMLAWNMYVFHMLLVFHMGDALAMARICANFAFIYFAAGLSASFARTIRGRR